ncbi:phosphoribosylglycinamide formyltransferase [Gellertiella hungarica]|uniref:Phosphoribosylglycinamide formyltransferase n=1 Tax=Gellertiella hungarica TaxID=1572859 RepID=A0A7W6J664_9HYPH|nr:phosphoribosylglycinamide formyltransferase [Gellertiella hungarica]MBB4065520.1 phosphoribosylglycinamide formyltransferase-1 [Gellertiella hungarica]
MSPARKRAVVFISGGGSNMVALARAAQTPGYPVEIVGVIADKADAGGLEKAASMGIPTFAFQRGDFDSKAAHERAILTCLEGLTPDLLCLAGYMRLLSADFIRHYEGRILNIHPSLLPLFPGLHTHQRAIDAGMTEAGCTVHVVTEGMDEGPVLAQARVPVLPGDTAETLAARVLVEEHKLYPATLRAFAEDLV